MRFNDYSRLAGKHAFLGASTCSWLNYDSDKLVNRYHNHLATMKGTQLHDLAESLIRLGVKLPRTKKTLDRYVNDAIGFNMSPEQVLFYSENCFGTADAISFRNNMLRIHDLKTGVTPARMDQLLIYAALFCLEYQVKPGDIEMELRIYQLDDVLVCNPTAEDILPIMDKIITFDKVIKKIQQEEV